MSFGQTKFLLGALMAAFLVLSALPTLPAPWIRWMAGVAAALVAVALLVVLARRRDDVQRLFKARRQEMREEIAQSDTPWRKVKEQEPGWSAQSGFVLLLMFGISALFLYFLYAPSDAEVSRRISVHLVDALFGAVFGNPAVGWKMLVAALSVLFFVNGAELLVMLSGKTASQPVVGAGRDQAAD